MYDSSMSGAVAGIDGCKGGWIAVVGKKGRSQVQVSARFGDLISCIGKDAVVAVDMPIGLPERGDGGRACERVLKQKLGKAASSVFPIPSRNAVYAVPEAPRRMAEIAAGHRIALAVARQTSDPSTGFSRQAFMIFPKIREIDAFLTAQRNLGAQIHESHPEGAFWKMNGERPLEHRKKLKGRISEPGMAERRNLLIENGFDPAWLQSGDAEARRLCPAGVSIGADDFLDACAMAVVASKVRADRATPLPENFGRDGEGLPMVIWV